MGDHIRIKDLPDRERPRERLLEHGAEALRNAELIAILLRMGTKGRSAIQVADDLLALEKQAAGKTLVASNVPLHPTVSKMIFECRAATLSSTLAGPVG